MERGVSDRPYRAVTLSSSEFGHLLVNKFEREAIIEVSHHPGLDLAEQDQRFKRRAVFCRDGGAGPRHIDNPAGHLGAVLEREQCNRVARYNAVVAAVFRQVENVAVGEPGQLRRELVAFARGRAHGHGKTVVDNAGDPALNPADMVEIGDHAVADIADPGRQQGQSTRRHINDLARKFAPVRQHIAPKQMDFHPLEAPSLFGGRKNRLFVRQRHLRHQTTGISESFDPTAGKVNEPLAMTARSVDSRLVSTVASIRRRGRSTDAGSPQGRDVGITPRLD